MFVSFSVENFLSFRERVKVTCQAGSIKEFQQNVHSIPSKSDIKLLKALAFYGANSSGKSNLIKAVSLMKDLVLSSSKESQAHEIIKVLGFKLEEGYEQKPSVFEIELFIDQVMYRYGFSISPKKIIQEWLFVTVKKKEESLFIRVGQTIELSKTLKGGDLKNKIHMLSEITRENALFISVLSQFNIALGTVISNWFSNVMIVYDANNDEIINFTASLLANAELKGRINEVIFNSDLGFSSVDAKIKDIAKKHSKNEQFISALYTDEVFSILTKHKKFKSGKHVENVYFDLLTEESLGSQKFFGLLGPIIQALISGRLILIDELDSRLHPLLLVSIINLFNSSLNNPNGAQFLFTIHNTDPLKESLRRDQMILVEKSDDGASEINSLYAKNPKVRKDASFQKDYLEGGFGAIPKLGQQLDLFSTSFEE